MMRTGTSERGVVTRWLVLLAVWLASVGVQARDDVLPGDYSVVSGRVDRGTYTGWRLFHSTCYGCHGTDATGTDLAPNLVERIKTLSQRDFVAKVLTSYRLVVPADTVDRNVAFEAMLEAILRRERNPQVKVIMPAFEADPKVSPHVLDLYAYLLARADGKIGPGKPKKLNK